MNLDNIIKHIFLILCNSSGQNESNLITTCASLEHFKIKQQYNVHGYVLSRPIYFLGAH